MSLPAGVRLSELDLPGHIGARCSELIPATELQFMQPGAPSPLNWMMQHAHIPVAAKLMLGPVQDPSAPAYHTAS